MYRLSDEIKNRYADGLKEFIMHEEEEFLTYAYEMGRNASKEGVSELDLIAFHNSRLIELSDIGLDLDYREKVKRASDYLIECLAPFEVKLDSYRNVIDELEEKNERLQEEIKNRRQVEEELFHSKEYFQSLIENGQDIITVLDHNGIIRYYSPSVERILGYSHDELIGRDVFQYLHEKDRERIGSIFQDLIAVPDRTFSAEFRFKHKEEGWVYLESIAKNVEDSPDGPIVVVNSRDVTERKRAVRKLEEHKMQLAEAQRIAKVGSWEWDVNDGEEVIWSDEMCRIFGLQPGEFDQTYDTFIQHVHPEDRSLVEKGVQHALEGEGSFVVENRIIRWDDEERNLLCRGRVVTDEDGNVRKMIGTGQDVTEQKEKERKLREYSQRLRNLSEKIERAREEERIRISRQVHDELGQMLTVLKMDVSMMRGEMKQKGSDEILKHFNKQAEKVLERINVIIESVQRITTELRPEVLDDLGLKEAIMWEADEFEKRTGITVEFASNIGQTDCLNDEKSTTLFRIFQETLTNVIRHANATEVNIDLFQKDSSLFLIVEDNGVGITKEEKEASSSLGLIGMHERTQFLGGDVEIKGEKGKGTTVTLKVPLNGDH